MRSGLCLDVGSGPAPLAIALVLQSDLRVTILDSSPRMQSLVVKNIHALLLKDKIHPVLDDVHAIPASAMTIDLVVSRGSYHFWKDLTRTFSEILRVLKPGGMAYIGGGYGSAEIRDEVLATRKNRGVVDDPDHLSRTRFRKFRAGEIESSIRASGFSDFRIISDDSGFWMLLYP